MPDLSRLLSSAHRAIKNVYIRILRASLSRPAVATVAIRPSPTSPAVLPRLPSSPWSVALTPRPCSQSSTSSASSSRASLSPRTTLASTSAPARPSRHPSSSRASSFLLLLSPPRSLDSSLIPQRAPNSIQNAGIKALPSIINACLLTSAWSAASSDLYTSSRALYGLALNGQAPAILKKTNRWGLPWVAVLVGVAFSLLSFMSVGSTSAGTVFGYL